MRTKMKWVPNQSDLEVVSPVKSQEKKYFKLMK